MSTSNTDPATLPGRTLDAKTVPPGSTDDTLAGQGLLVTSPPPDSPPPPLPPSGGGPPAAEPTLPKPNAALGDMHSVPILIGVFMLTLVGIGLLGLGLYAVIKLNSNMLAAVGAGTATRVPLLTQVVLVPTTTTMPTKAATATALPATPTRAATTAAAATTPITAAASLTAAA